MRRNATISVVFMKIPFTGTKPSERTLRITAASVLALIMVSAAYLLSGPNFLTSRAANAASTDALLQAYAAKDTDADGLPDWEEALYGTDPNKAISNSFGIPDGQAAREGKLTPNALASQLPNGDQGTSTPFTDADFGGTPAPAPGSITEQFSREFLQQYVAASNGQPMDAATQQQLVTNLLSTIGQKVSGTMTSSYALVDVHTNTSVSLTQYAASVESALQDNSTTDMGDPYDLMLTAIESTDSKEQASAAADLVKVSRVFASMAVQLRSTSVPPSLASAHVLLVQSIEMLSRSTAIISVYQKDPLATLGALQTYSTASDSFSAAFGQLATSLIGTGEPAKGTPGYLIVSLARLSHS